MEMTFGQAVWMLIFHICISVPTLFLGWILYYNIVKMHVPPGITQRTKLRIIYFSITIFLKLALILERLGICQELVIWRILVDGIFPVGASADLIIEEMIFDTVPVRVYRGKTLSPENRRGLVWIHGGGGLTGSLESHERFCRFFAQETATVVVSIGYPLAPEHPCPAQQLSCYTAISHFLKNVHDFGVDPQRIVLGGDSGGGAFVVAIAQQLVRRKDLPQLRGHVLLYPFLQCVDFNLPSYQQNHSVPLLAKSDAIRWGMFYLTGRKMDINGIMSNAHVPEQLRAKYQKWIGAEHIPDEFKARGYVPFVPRQFSEELFKVCERVFDPTFSPLLTEDAVLREFPETFLLTCEYDLFRDDGLLYKKRLEDNGVPITWHYLKDGFHGISLLIGFGPMEFPGTRSSLKSLIQFLERF